MKFNQIVVSLLDTDLYKFNMNQVIFHIAQNCIWFDIIEKTEEKHHNVWKQKSQ